MPKIIQGDRRRADRQNIIARDFNYDYPEGMNLKPGSKLHDLIADAVYERGYESAAVLSNRFDSWNEVDRVLNAYIQVDDDEEKVLDGDPRKPVSIVFPYTYAIMETLLSYLFLVFSQSPIFRYDGIGPEDVPGAFLMEKVIEQHCLRNKVGLGIHTLCRDALAYGVGAVSPVWTEVYGKRPKVQRNGFRNFLGRFIETGEEVLTEEQLLYEGNALDNINPYLMLPDPQVGIHDIQRGEFFGWVSEENLMDLLKEEENDEDMFNVRYAKVMTNRLTSIYADGEGDRTLRTVDKDRNPSGTVNNPVDVINMFIKLVPKDWKLGDGEVPELWYFRIAGDQVVITAKPIDLNHGKIPVATAAPDFDGYSLTPMSRVEMIYELQGILDFMFNSHVANVRKAVNDMLVVDPSIINVGDLKNPKAGKIIRTRRPAWGKGVQNAVQQLGINDITRANIGDSGFIVNWMQKVVGADNPIMGSLRQGGPERLSSAEFQGTQAGAFGRLDRVARVIGLQAMQDIGYMFASHTQQFMKQDTYVQAVGQWPDVVSRIFNLVRERVPVSPYDLFVDYDVRVLDGSLPGGSFTQNWIQLYQIIAGNPELQQKFDMVRIFEHIAQGLGAKNVDKFRRVETQVVSDEEAMRMADQGRTVAL